MRALLESEGINAHLFDEHIVSSNWMQSDLFGNVKLVVRNDQYADAVNVFEQLQAGVFLDALSVEHQLTRRHCPSCSALDLYSYPCATDRAVVVLSKALFSFFHPLPWGRFKCAACQKCFEVSDD
jgi:hypothetical protein